MKTIEIQIPDGMYDWLISQKNWAAVVVLALIQHRHNKK